MTMAPQIPKYSKARQVSASTDGLLSLLNTLRHMRTFHHAFPIRDALRRELSWTHLPSLVAIRRKFRQVRTDATHEAAR